MTTTTKHGAPRRARRAASTRGAALVELAIVAPLLLVILLGMIDLGRAAYEAIEIENAAHAGAFYGSQNKSHAADADGIRGAALRDIGDFVDRSGVTVKSVRTCECSDGQAIDCEDSCPAPELKPLIFVRVRLDKTFRTLFPYPGIPAVIPLHRETTLRVD